MGSKPITSNVTVPTTSFLRVLCHCKFVTIGVNKYYLHYRCSMSYDVIYDSFPINSQYLKTCEVLTALYMVVLLINQSVFHHLVIAVLKMLIQENLGLSPWRNFSLLVHKKVDFSFHLRVVQFQWAFVLQPPPLNSGLFSLSGVIRCTCVACLWDWTTGFKYWATAIYGRKLWCAPICESLVSVDGRFITKHLEWRHSQKNKVSTSVIQI